MNVSILSDGSESGLFRERSLLAGLVLAGLAGGCQLSTGPADPEPGARPNVVIIVADDLGYGDIEANGSELIATPNIDGLARDGVRLTDGYVSAAVCSPTRAGLFTGRYQNRFGYEYNPTNNYVSGPDSELGLPEGQTTLGDLMRGAGYVTGLIGKWHLGALEQYHPLNRGFDEFFGHLGGGTSYFDGPTADAVSWPGPILRGRESPRDVREILDGFEVVKVEEYLTDAFADRAVDFIERHASKPFFLMLTPNAPHTPIQATTEYVDRNLHIEREGARIFAAMVSAVDDMVGDVVDALRRNSIERNTLVVFLSDNGCINYVSDAICTNSPLSGAKRYHLEGGVRVPFLLKWPDGLPQGAVYGHPVISLDLYATLGAVAGVDESALDGRDGVNLIPYLRSEAEGPPHEFLFWRSAPNRSVRWGNWKLWKVDRTDLEESALQGGRLLPNVEYPPVSAHGQLTVLHDLSTDVGEQVNLASDHPDIVERLEGELDAWNATLAEPMWTSRRSTVDRLHGEMVQLYF